MLIGHGNIGSVLRERLLGLGHKVPFVVRSGGLYNDLEHRVGEKEEYKSYIGEVDAVCIAIKTTDDGKAAYGYMLSALKHGIPVVTSEKGALSNFPNELEPYIGRIGYSSTVGGNSEILQYGKQKMNGRVDGIHAIINGSLNYIFDELSKKGKNLYEVIKEAKRLGYTEPGAETPLEVINVEEIDASMKIPILFKTLGLGIIKASDIHRSYIDELDLKELVIQARKRRYIVSVTKEYKKEDVIAESVDYINGWFISAGFKNTRDNPLFRQLMVNGTHNSILLYRETNENGGYSIIGKTEGPGAGPIPTTTAMIIDLQKLLK